jgi:methanogenic corrinoid protein MtbC1
MTGYNAIKDALIACDVGKLTGLVNSSLALDVAAGDILNNGLIAGMEVHDLGVDIAPDDFVAEIIN